MKNMRFHLWLRSLLAFLVGGLSWGGHCGETAVRAEDDLQSEAAQARKHPLFTPRLSIEETPKLPKSEAFQLGGDTKAQAPPPRPAPAATQPLSEAQLQALWARLPAFEAKPDDTQAVMLKKSTRPPPLSGGEVEAPFPPPPTTAQPPEEAPAEPGVLRAQPEGAVPMAPRISLTFASPMVPLSSHEALALAQLPVTLDPPLAGVWRWVGTRTLFFEPEGERTPMATVFQVRLKPGVKDALGRPLPAYEGLQFHTPAPSLNFTIPAGRNVGRSPVLAARFDQRVDAQTYIRSVQVLAGQRVLPVRALSQAATEQFFAERSGDAERARWVLFEPAQPLPVGSQITVRWPAGMPSAEGPRRTEAPIEWTFNTYGALQVERSGCEMFGECLPGSAFRILLSNPLDEAQLKGTQITVDPPMKGLRVEVEGRALVLQGESEGRKHYQVRLSSQLTDEFGQTLGEDVQLDWRVSPGRAHLFSELSQMSVLDPGLKQPQLELYAINLQSLDLELRRVSPEDWPAYLEALSEQNRKGEEPTFPGTLLESQPIEVVGADEAVIPVKLDLTDALEGGRGHLIVRIRPKPRKELAGQKLPEVVTWVQATQLAVDALYDREQLVVWTTDLKTGQGLGEVQVKLGDLQAQSDAQGLARFELPAQLAPTAPLIVRTAQDSAFLPSSEYLSGRSPWLKKSGSTAWFWYAFNDRGLYRPGEKISVKGIIRQRAPGIRDGLSFAPSSVKSVQWILKDASNRELQRGSRPLSALGSFDLQVALPEEIALGMASLTFIAGERPDVSNHLHRFDVQAFRRPDFEVKASPSPGPYFVKDTAKVSVAARYFAGGALPDAPVRWQVRPKVAYFTPPNHGEFSFGRWRPWWRGGAEGSGIDERVQMQEGHTDAQGEHQVSMSFKPVEPPQPVTIQAEATLTDVNRRAWTAEAQLLVHPSNYYVGLKPKRWFARVGEPLQIATVVSDVGGARQAGQPVQVRLERLTWQKLSSGQWVEQPAEEAPLRCEVRSAQEPAECAFEPQVAGRYRVTAEVSDAQGRQNQTVIELWMAGGSVPVGPRLDETRLTLIPNAHQWRPGEVAEILVQAPFEEGQGLYAVSSGDIAQSGHFVLEKGSATVRVPIEEWMLPGVELSVLVNGSSPRADAAGQVRAALPAQPAFSYGTLPLAVSTAARVLQVQLTPQAEQVEPGAKTVLQVEVKNAAGEAVEGAQVVVMVVDEAVLAVSGAGLPNPMHAFYTARATQLRRKQSRDRVLLASAAQLLGQVPPEILNQMGKSLAPPMPKAMQMRAMHPMPAPAVMGASPGGMESLAAEAGPPINLRTNFDALALFEPEARTDAQGRVSLTIPFPDNLTRYRIAAVALSGTDRFGVGESHVTARLPLMVRATPPRFLNYGDQFALSVTVQNQADQALPVQVGVRAHNVKLAEGGGRLVEVPAQTSAEVLIPMETQRPGRARLQVGVVSGRWGDALQVEVPVWTPSTAESFATYGVIDQGGVRQPVQMPEQIHPGVGGLEVQTSTTQLQALTDAVLYLAQTPYSYPEQIASRLLALSALRPVLSAFEAEGLPEPAELEARLKADIERLQSLQRADGGYAFWGQRLPSDPFLSVHVAHALLRAQQMGFSPSAQALRASQGYLKQIQQHLQKMQWSAGSRRVVEAYALYTRAMFGDVDLPRAQALLAEEGDLAKANLELVGWLYPVLRLGKDDPGLAAVRREINQRVRETAGAANFTTHAQEGARLLLHSDRRVDGLLLEGLVEDQPQSDLLPKLVRGLLAHRKAGRWQGTQESAWVLLGLQRYFERFEKESPRLTVQTWLADLFAGEQRFEGRDGAHHQLSVPMQVLAEQGGEADLVLSKKGEGRLYYRLGLRYAPSSLTLPAADHGFRVQRTYEAVDDPADVMRDAEGRWVIKAGARVKVSVQLSSPDRRYHVALSDPLPAGFEILNERLRGTETLPQDADKNMSGLWRGGPLGGGYLFYASRQWYEHESLHDDRAEAFTQLLWGGIYHYSYFARAITPGRFIVPPTRAEEMYMPETFGRGEGDIVIVRVAGE